MYFQGTGVPKSYREGANWYKRAADHGDALAQYLVAVEYDHGRGFATSPKDAVTYYTLSARQGNPEGEVGLCLMYFLGRGVSRDYIQAYMWCSLAVTNAPTEAERASFAPGLDQVADRMNQGEIAEAKRRANAWRPVDLRKSKTLCLNAACTKVAGSIE